MKKISCFFVICLVGAISLTSCASAPKVKDISGNVEILEHRGSAWGVAQPDWVSKAMTTSNQAELKKALGIDKHIWVFDNQGKNLEYLQNWVDQVNARAEIAASIKQGVADSVTAQLKGKSEEDVKTAIERYSKRAEMVMIAGLNKETEWWSRTRTRLDKKSDYEIKYQYFVVYSLDEQLYKEQIERAFAGFDDESGIVGNQIVEDLFNRSKIILKPDNE